MSRGFSGLIFMLALGLSSSSCRSIKATYIGDPVHGEEVGGLPIVVMQPRYLKVTYSTVTWRAGKAEKAAEQETREIATETIEVGEIYALDVERPLAGSADYDIELSKDRYYPAKVAAKIDDKTLATVASSLEKLADRLASPRGERGAAGDEDGGRIRVRDAVERIEVYDLRDLSRPVAVYR